MKTTKKIILTGMACLLYASGLFAGGLLTNTNQSVHFLRNPARDASTEIDAVYTNPAGLTQLSEEGLHFSLNNQSAFQTRTITQTFAPFAMNGGNETKAFKGTAEALFIPSILAAYKTGDWVFSGSFTIAGGGGSLVFDKGLPSFEMLAASQLAGPLTQLSQAAGLPAGYSLDMHLEGSSIIYGVQLGATYKINDMFSAFVGGRVNIVDNGYEGYLRNVQITGADGLKNFFTTAAGQLGALAGGLQGINANLPLSVLPPASFALYQSVLGDAANALTVGQAQGILNQKAAEASGAAAGVTQLENGAAATNMALNTKQTGIGITPIIGFNFNWEKLNVGVKYEFMTKLELKNNTKENTTPMPAFDDKVKTPYDLPALLTIGAQYDVLPCVTVSAGYHHFFDSDAKMANDKQKYINGGINEYLFGAEYRFCEKFLISGGIQFTRSGVTDDYQSDLSFSLNSYAVSFGGACDITKSIRVNLGYLYTNYEDWTLKAQPITFARTNQAFGIGVDFRF
jgi:long-chain fatty acid transport protein